MKARLCAGSQFTRLEARVREGRMLPSLDLFLVPELGLIQPQRPAQCAASMQLGLMSRFEIYTVYLLRNGLNNEDQRQSASLTETLHCTIKLLIALRATRGRQERGNPHSSVNEREMLIRRA